MTIEALIFDVDGTLADTEEAHRVAFNLAFERHRLGWHWSRSDYRQLLEVTGGKERIASYIDTLEITPAERARLRGLVPALHAEKTRFYTAAVQDGGVPLRAGVARLLHEARDAGCRLAIASTTTAPNIHALLASTLGPRGLDLFSVIACGDQVRAKKPAPDIYRLALATLGLAPERALALEDSVNGLRASTGAGLWTLVTPTFWTEGGEFGAAALVLPGLGEPDAPLAGEPGCQLHTAGWLRFDELCARASPPPALTPLQALYRGLTT
ncbi:MAG: HAD family hydrolase [Burkholderiales bacterium]|nr:MAG: HAD family hydrolase [Burkholderiales bacterium]